MGAGSFGIWPIGIKKAGMSLACSYGSKFVQAYLARHRDVRTPLW